MKFEFFQKVQDRETGIIGEVVGISRDDIKKKDISIDVRWQDGKIEYNILEQNFKKFKLF